MKKILFLLTISIYVLNTQAQNAKKITFPHRYKTASIGLGKNSLSDKTKTKSNALGDIQMVASLSLPLAPIGKNAGFSIKTNLDLGITIGTQSTANYSSLNVQGQTTGPLLKVEKITFPPRYRIMVSPTFDLGLGNLIVSPSIGIGYMSQTQPALTVTQTTITNASTFSYKILHQSETKTNGMLISPQLRTTYWLGRIGIWAEAQYIMGPGIENTVTKLVPPGPPVGGNYTLSQMETGTQQTLNMETIKYRSLGINGGISIAFGKPKANYIRHTTIIKKQEPINGKISYGSCPSCGNAFSNNDDVYHHSCLRTWIDQEFNTSLKWVSTDWNGEIDGIFNLPHIFSAIPISKSIEDYLKELVKEKLVSIKIESNEVTLITKSNDKFITDVLITNPDPAPLAHILGVKISCLGSCPTGCQVDNTNGTYYCVKCNDINEAYVCKTNVKGDYGFDRTYETLRSAMNLYAIDETNNGNEEYKKNEIKELVKENLPTGFLPIKSELVVSGKTRNLLLHCTNGKSAVILVGRITENLLSNQFIIVQGNGVPTKINNLEKHIKKSLKVDDKTSAKKHQYVGHVTLLCRRCGNSYPK
jgi:hypothetical protein